MTREEAIKEAYGIPVTKAQHEALQILIPELEESEDERIRKALIHLISEQDGILTAINGISVKNILAWLEKQKEQKPAECLNPEKDCWYVCIKDFYCGGKKQSSKGDLVQAKGGMYMMGREDISEWFRKAYYDEIKPAEWSEKCPHYSEGYGCEISPMKKCESCEKRPHPHWKPSDEQMKALKIAVDKLIMQYPGRKIALQTLYGDLKKL